MARAHFLTHFLLLPALLLSWSASALAAARPNVLLIYTDDHAQWAVGAYGNEEIYTPNMDRLAAEGMRFTRGFTKPVCSPSRAMLLTGQYSHRLGIPDYIPFGNPVHIDNGLPAGTATVASMLKKSGYATGLVGKWHLGYGEKYFPQRFGFDSAEGFRFLAPGKEATGVGKIPFLVNGNEISNFRGDPRHTDILADRAIDFFLSHRDEPFFLFLSLYRPHLPWGAVPPEDLAHYERVVLTVPELPNHSWAMREKLEELTRLYYANITCADRNLGRVFDALDDLSLTENTLVIFIGDNGFMVGQQNLLGKGNARRFQIDERERIARASTRANMFDDSVLVPFIVRWPGVVKPGSTNDALVSTIDILPTLAEATGAESPSGIDGKSLLPLLKNTSSAPWRDAWLDTYDMIYLGDDGEKPHMRMIRTNDWKLILYHDENGRPLDGGSRHELFDLKRDPDELENRYADPSAGKIRQTLEKRLLDWIQSSGVAK
jgi:choline-sulfatase